MVAVVVGVVVGVDGGCLGPPLLVTPPEDVKSRLPAPPGLAEDEERGVKASDSERGSNRKSTKMS